MVTEELKQLTGLINPAEGTIEIPRLGVTVECERVIELWSCEEEPEGGIPEDQDEAIADFLDCCDVDVNNRIVINDRGYPKTVKVFGFARMKVNVAQAMKMDVLNRLLEELDAEYAWEDAGPTEETPKMREAEEVFLRTVIAEYKPSLYEVVKTVEVDTEEWIKRKRPKWLEG